jgi:hypothetical protein
MGELIAEDNALNDAVLAEGAERVSQSGIEVDLVRAMRCANTSMHAWVRSV